jgi:hypothetical protein
MTEDTHRVRKESIQNEQSFARIFRLTPVYLSDSGANVSANFDKILAERGAHNCQDAHRKTGSRNKVPISA